MLKLNNYCRICVYCKYICFYFVESKASDCW